MPPLAVGFVYVMSNVYLTGLVKIGRTDRLPEDRAKEIQTGVPSSFEVLFRLVTSWPVEVERKTHELLSSQREAPNREFFRTSPDVAIDAVRRAAKEVAGIDAWARQPIHRLRHEDRVALTLRSGQIFALLAYPHVLSPSAEIKDFWQAHSDFDVLEIFADSDPGHVAGMRDNDAGSDIDPVPYLDRAGAEPNGTINGRERLVPGDRLLWLGMQDESNDGMLFEAESNCQIIGRTWTPKLMPDGYLLPFNIPTLPKLPEGMLEPIRKALTLPFPRVWAPRQLDEDIGMDPPPPEHWLRQLEPRRKRRTIKGRPRGSGHGTS